MSRFNTMSSFHEGQLSSLRKLYIFACLASLGLYRTIGRIILLCILGATVVEVKGVDIADRGFYMFGVHVS